MPRPQVADASLPHHPEPSQLEHTLAAWRSPRRFDGRQLAGQSQVIEDLSNDQRVRQKRQHLPPTPAVLTGQHVEVEAPLHRFSPEQLAPLLLLLEPGRSVHRSGLGVMQGDLGFGWLGDHLIPVRSRRRQDPVVAPEEVDRNRMLGTVPIQPEQSE